MIVAVKAITAMAIAAAHGLLKVSRASITATNTAAPTVTALRRPTRSEPWVPTAAIMKLATAVIIAVAGLTTVPTANPIAKPAAPAIPERQLAGTGWLTRTPRILLITPELGLPATAALTHRTMS